MDSVPLVAFCTLPPRHLLEPQCVYELIACFKSEQGRSILNRLWFDFVSRHISFFLALADAFYCSDDRWVSCNSSQEFNNHSVEKCLYEDLPLSKCFKV